MNHRNFYKNNSSQMNKNDQECHLKENSNPNQVPIVNPFKAVSSFQKKPRHQTTIDEENNQRYFGRNLINIETCPSSIQDEGFKSIQIKPFKQVFPPFSLDQWEHSYKHILSNQWIPLQKPESRKETYQASKLELEKEEKKEEKNPQYVIEYIYDIALEMKKNELSNIPEFVTITRKSNDKINEPLIKDEPRRKLINWLIEVHLRFELLQNTLYLTINIIDRMMDFNDIPVKKLQLLGVTALFIASKYEEIYPPELIDFVSVTNKSVTRKEILSMEMQIWTKLHFQWHVVSPYLFLDRFYFLAGDKRKEVYNLALMIIEFSLMDRHLLKYKQSLISASAYYLARKIVNKEEIGWTEVLQLHSEYKEKELKSFARDFSVFYRNNLRESNYKAISGKYSSAKFLKVFKWFAGK